MLRHVVLFRWSDASTPEQRAAAIDGLRRLPSVVPAIRAFLATRAAVQMELPD